MKHSFLCKKSLNIYKRDGVIWYWPLFISKMLQNITVEKAKFTNRMSKFIRGRQPRIFLACCAWMKRLCNNLSNIQKILVPPYPHTMTVRCIQSARRMVRCRSIRLQAKIFYLQQKMFSSISYDTILHVKIEAFTTYPRNEGFAFCKKHDFIWYRTFSSQRRCSISLLRGLPSQIRCRKPRISLSYNKNWFSPVSYDTMLFIKNGAFIFYKEMNPSLFR